MLPPRPLVLVLLAVLLLAAGGMAWVLEQEPNNHAPQANLIACGDTVYCATLPTADTDCFRFTMAAYDSLVATTWPCAGSHSNTLIALCNSRDSLLMLNNDSGLEEFSRVHWLATTAGEYRVYVYRWTTSIDSTYSLTLECPVYVAEDYDLCSTPRIVPALPYFDETGSTLGMTSQCGLNAPDVFYRFNNPVTRTLRLAVCTTQFDARVQIITGCCGEYLDDQNVGCGSGAVLNTYNLPAGDYNVLVEGTTASAAGRFSLEITAEPLACPAPGPIVLATIGGYPTLDWPELDGPAYYVIWQSSAVNGWWEHLGTTYLTYFTDSAGYTAPRRFYYVSAVCLW